MRKKICFIVASPFSALVFLKNHIEVLSESYDIYLIANSTNRAVISNLNITEFKEINIVRSINIKSDIKALLELYKYFKSNKFDAVHSVTPKAGLLVSIAAYLAKIKNRIHIFTGQVWATKKGFKRQLLKTCDRIISLLNNYILVDGNGQLQFLLDNKVVNCHKAKVLGNGSICGVDTEKFNPNINVRNNIRDSLGLKKEKVVFVFMGRLNRDKGVVELLSAYNQLVKHHSDLFLILIGSDEEDYKETFTSYKNLNKDNFLYYGLTDKPFEMLQVADIFVLPTFREGFGSSLIEASCLGLPVITTDVYGVKDAVIDNETGLKCRVGDINSLYDSMNKLYLDKDLRIRLGSQGRKRVLEKFSKKYVTSEWRLFYQSILN